MPLTAASTQLRAGLLPRRLLPLPLDRRPLPNAGPTSSSSRMRVLAYEMLGAGWRDVAAVADVEGRLEGLG